MESVSLFSQYMTYCFLIRFLFDLKIPFIQRMSFDEFLKYHEKVLRQETY